MSFKEKRKFRLFEHLPIIVRAARSFLFLTTQSINPHPL